MLSRGTLVLLRNSQRDGRKGGKLQKRWIGPYSVSDSLGKGVYKLCNPTNGKNLKKAVNICRLKIYHSKMSSHPISVIPQSFKLTHHLSQIPVKIIVTYIDQVP